MSTLFDAVRGAAKPGVWSQGVLLAKGGAVVVDAETPDEITLRVRAPGKPVAPTVALYPASDEWACDCDAPTDPCAHVAAAAIALSNGSASRAEAKPAGAPAAARLVHQLTAPNGSLTLRRIFARDGAPDEPLTTSLASLVARGACPVLPTHDDLALDRMAQGFTKQLVPKSRTIEVLGLLATAREVRLDGERVAVSGEPMRAVARVSDDAGGGVVVRIARDPRVDAVVAHGVARVGDTLHPIAGGDAYGESLERLPRDEHFPPARLGELVAKRLPELERACVVAIDTRRLPGMARALAPRLAFEIDAEPGALAVVPLLVYGDPPVARVDQGELVHLGGDAVPVRDAVAEREIVARLRDRLNLVPGRRVVFARDEATRFVASLRAFREAEPGGVGGDLTQGKKLVPRFAALDERFELAFDVEHADGRVERDAVAAESVLRAFRSGYGVVPLAGGSFAPLPADFLARHGQKIADLLAAKGEAEKVPTVALPVLAELCDELGSPRPPSFARLEALLEGFERVPDVEPPAFLAAELRPYQRLGVSWLAFLRDAGLGGVLADDMGLGKTLQAIAAMRGRALVVCPKSVVFNWARELARFAPSLRVALYHGPKRAFDDAADVTITTYAMLRSDVEQLSARAFDTIVLDEAQAIKNPDSQVARAAFTLEGAFKLALSGTPVENRLDELWSVMRFANPGLLGARSDFRDRYEEPIARGEAKAASRLRERVRPFVLRRMKREVAPELPPRTEATLLVELDENERAVYDAVRAASLKEVAARLESGGVLAALEALLRMRQAACHSGLVPGQVAEGSSKVDALVECLVDASADGHRALVFSQWTSLLDRVEPALAAAGISFVRLDGQTRDREGVVAEFQAEGGPPVMLLSLKAGGTGLNLTAADHVFLLDPWWNPAVEDQAADRAHRIGQDKPVVVYRMVAKDTVEERILELQARKRAIADAALGEAGQAAAITRDDLMALFA